jgi:hypothetical protein
MDVIWTFTPTRDGTRVEIVHNLKFRVPLLAWLVEPIIGRFFIENIANKTLATFKQHLESEIAPRRRAKADAAPHQLSLRGMTPDLSRRAVITGLGADHLRGTGHEALWESIHAGRSGSRGSRASIRAR